MPAADVAGYGDANSGDRDRSDGGGDGHHHCHRHPAAADVPTIPAPELHAIRALLRSFVPEAVGRHHPGRAWDLATPAMRSTTTRADWRHGSLPVFPYPASATSFGIRPISVSPNDVTFDLMLQPTPGSDVGVEVFTTEVQRIGGRWLVASMAASAQFAGPGGPSTITAEPDFAPSLQGTPQSNNIDQKWALVPFAVLGALDAHLQTHVFPVGETLGARAMQRLRALRTTALTVFCAYITFVVAGLAFFGMVDDSAFIPAMTRTVRSSHAG